VCILAGQPGLEQLLKAHHYRGEILPVRLLRGVLGTILLGGIAVYVLHATVFKPIWETTHLPTKELRISNHNTVPMWDFKLGRPVWNIQVGTIDCAEIKINETFKPMLLPFNDGILDGMLDGIQVVSLGNWQGMSFQP